MRRSQLFVKTRKETPADETAKNAQLLIRAGFIHKEMAGVYSFLPLGLMVIENIKRLIREEMNSLGASELVMSTLQRPELWQKTDRWDEKKVDVWFKSKFASGHEAGLAWSHEEPISDMMRSFLASYRDLPAYTYQFQNKLRNELRAKSGIMRCREFIMKDMYSFSPDEMSHQAFYDRVKASYLKVFGLVGLGDDTYETFASGGAFTQFSHEFQTVTPNGEDTIYLDRAKKLAINKEVLTDETLSKAGLKKEGLEEVRASEVGNIFSFGTIKSEQLGLNFTDEQGRQKPIVLGSYGIGVTRLMGVIAEHFADDRGLVWPESVAPVRVYLARLGEDSPITQAADELYSQLTDAGIGVLYDDRKDISPGEMFADADLLGIPYRLVISSKTQAQNSIELKKREADAIELVTKDAVIEVIAKQA